MGTTSGAGTAFPKNNRTESSMIVKQVGYRKFKYLHIYNSSKIRLVHTTK
jgi:hypothetical protein